MNKTVDIQVKKNVREHRKDNYKWTPQHGSSLHNFRFVKCWAIKDMT